MTRRDARRVGGRDVGGRVASSLAGGVGEGRRCSRPAGDADLDVVSSMCGRLLSGGSGETCGSPGGLGRSLLRWIGSRPAGDDVLEGVSSVRGRLLSGGSDKGCGSPGVSGRSFHRSPLSSRQRISGRTLRLASGLLQRRSLQP